MRLARPGQGCCCLANGGFGYSVAGFCSAVAGVVPADVCADAADDCAKAGLAADATRVAAMPPTTRRRDALGCSSLMGAPCALGAANAASRARAHGVPGAPSSYWLHIGC